MNKRCAVLAFLVIATIFTLGACSRAAEAPAHKAASAAKVEAVPGSTSKRLTLTAKAVDRLGIKTSDVRSVEAASGSRTAIPYAAVLYDAHGVTWTYTSPEANVFLRQEITVDFIEGTDAYLSAGPPVGTSVVTVGAAELFGTEFEVGH